MAITPFAKTTSKTNSLTCGTGCVQLLPLEQHGGSRLRSVELSEGQHSSVCTVQEERPLVAHEPTDAQSITSCTLWAPARCPQSQQPNSTRIMLPPLLLSLMMMLAEGQQCALCLNSAHHVTLSSPRSVSSQ
jgi:hypothetical protein